MDGIILAEWKIMNEARGGNGRRVEPAKSRLAARTSFIW
jgi:hypothetical protein